MFFVMILALSIVVAILFNFGAPRVASSKFGKYFVGSYIRATLGTALVFFLAIYVASLLMSAIGERASLPTVTAPAG
jgi:hypothetical protein